jgi:hypothetical protein
MAWWMDMADTYRADRCRPHRGSASSGGEEFDIGPVASGSRSSRIACDERDFERFGERDECGVVGCDVVAKLPHPIGGWMVWIANDGEVREVHADIHCPIFFPVKTRRRSAWITSTSRRWGAFRSASASARLARSVVAGRPTSAAKTADVSTKITVDRGLFGRPQRSSRPGRLRREWLRDARRRPRAGDWRAA